MVLNEEQWIKELREKRVAYGISQGRLAVASGITREYLNKIESGKMKPSKELLETLHKELARFNPEAPLTMLFDYVKIRFPTLDIQHIIKDILTLEDQRQALLLLTAYFSFKGQSENGCPFLFEELTKGAERT